VKHEAGTGSNSRGERDMTATVMAVALLLAKGIEGDDLCTLGRFWSRRWRGWLGLCGLGRRRRHGRGFGRRLVGRLELQTELDGRIGKTAHRLEGNCQSLVPATKAEGDGESLFLDGQIPKLVLQDDGHLLRVLLAQPIGNANAGTVGMEGDIEM